MLFWDAAGNPRTLPTPKQPPQHPRPPAVATLDQLADQHRDRPYLGASYGETLVASTAPQPTIEQPPLAPEPPPWKQDPAAHLGPPAPPPTPIVPGSALAQLKTEAGDENWPVLGPPLKAWTQAFPPTFPRPDWRAEETERAERDRPDEPTRSMQSRPA